ncbi:hypothetical protein GOP47_0015167 [Adiantum capillus-veneris]|uniref:Uncharacterized protein n=1 Tax=Adiantum capillus-veneris TaxID=13818 RepID=A0A9D4ZD39_ADICA|nr:hypothetical protein GOP47_0015167 [Adiantum capillus-veneris]
MAPGGPFLLHVDEHPPSSVSIAPPCGFQPPPLQSATPQKAVPSSPSDSLSPLLAGGAHNNTTSGPSRVCCPLPHTPLYLLPFTAISPEAIALILPFTGLPLPTVLQCSGLPHTCPCMLALGGPHAIKLGLLPHALLQVAALSLQPLCSSGQ